MQSLEKSCRILQNLPESCRILKNLEESCRSLHNLSESCKIFQTLTESCRNFYSLEVVGKIGMNYGFSLVISSFQNSPFPKQFLKSYSHYRAEVAVEELFLAKKKIFTDTFAVHLNVAKIKLSSMKHTEGENHSKHTAVASRSQSSRSSSQSSKFCLARPGSP